MIAFENVQFVASKKNDISVSQLNAMIAAQPYNQFFSRTTDDNVTVLVRAPHSFAKWLKTKSHYTNLVEWGRGPKLGRKRQTSFRGLYWREEKKRLYVLFDNRTIPWSNWCDWCEKQQAKKLLKVA